MSIRPNIRSPRLHSIHSPRSNLKNLDTSKQPCSRSNTPSTSRNRSFEPQPRQHMDSPTPTPRKARSKRNRPRRPEQRELGDDAPDQQLAELAASSEDDLFDLLGIAPVTTLDASTVPTVHDPKPQRGLLTISKEDIVESQKGRRGKKETGEGYLERKQSQNLKSTLEGQGPANGPAIEKGFDTSGSNPHGLPPKPATKSTRVRTKRKNGQKSDSTSSGIASTRTTQPLQSDTNGISIRPSESQGSQQFDLSMLSQSLPSQHGDMLAKTVTQNKGSLQDRDAGTAWDMPEVKGTQALTWQQQELQSQASSPEQRKSSRTLPSRQARKAPSAFQPSALNPSRPAHTRRASTDGLPLPAPPKSAPPAPSVFDNDVPYHIGFNVNRAPQTPSKAGLRTTLQNTPLPLIKGEFPRINKVFDNVLGQQSHTQSAPNSSMKYAGPTSHNSPHAASLAKPDLDDF